MHRHSNDPTLPGKNTTTKHKQRTPLYSVTSMCVNVCACEFAFEHACMHAPKVHFSLKVGGPQAKDVTAAVAAVEETLLLETKYIFHFYANFMLSTYINITQKVPDFNLFPYHALSLYVVGRHAT